MCHPGFHRCFYPLGLGKKVQVVLEELGWLSIKGVGEGKAGLVLGQAQSVRKKALRLWIGCGQQSGKFVHNQKRVGHWCLAVLFR